jgi:hypothetical protein
MSTRPRLASGPAKRAVDVYLGWAMVWAWYLLLLAVQCVGLFFTMLGLPGLWLMVIGVAGYAWWTGWDVYVGWPGLVAVTGLAVLAELIEFLSSSSGAKKAGASRRGMIGGIVGAIVGGIFFTGLVPIPILGTILGVCIGAFAGAAVVEMGVRGDAGHAGRVGWGAAKGSFFGIMYKLMVGVVILVVTACVAIPR